MNIRNNCFDSVLLAELRLGLPPLFFCRMVEIKDDWGFILKLHSFFEGVVTQLNREKLSTQKNTNESMTPRDSFISRIHLADRLGLMEPEFKTYLLALNSLRNEITHNIRYINFDLRSYVDQLSESDFRKKAMTLCVGIKNIPLESMSQKISQLSQIFQRARQPPKSAVKWQIKTFREFHWNLFPKLSIWLAGNMTLDMLSLRFHFEIHGNEIISKDAELEAKLQDLRLDPSVLEFEKKHFK